MIIALMAFGMNAYAETETVLKTSFGTDDAEFFATVVQGFLQDPAFYPARVIMKDDSYVTKDGIKHRSFVAKIVKTSPENAEYYFSCISVKEDSKISSDEACAKTLKKSTKEYDVQVRKLKKKYPDASVVQELKNRILIDDADGKFIAYNNSFVSFKKE